MHLSADAMSTDLVVCTGREANELRSWRAAGKQVEVLTEMARLGSSSLALFGPRKKGARRVAAEPRNPSQRPRDPKLPIGRKKERKTHTHDLTPVTVKSSEEKYR